MGIIGWIIKGALAGWIASMITGNNRKMGAGMNILVGIVGGFIGGIVMNLLGGYGATGFNLWLASIDNRRCYSACHCECRKTSEVVSLQ